MKRLTIDQLGAVHRDDIEALTWAAWFEDETSISWIGDHK